MFKLDKKQKKKKNKVAPKNEQHNVTSTRVNLKSPKERCVQHNILLFCSSCIHKYVCIYPVFNLVLLPEVICFTSLNSLITGIPKLP